MAESPAIDFEPRMLIDGALVEGEAGTFTNINPSTEEVLGEVTNASKADMHRAIDAARRAFDDTGLVDESRLATALLAATARSARSRA